MIFLIILIIEIATRKVVKPSYNVILRWRGGEDDLALNEGNLDKFKSPTPRTCFAFRKVHEENSEIERVCDSIREELHGTFRNVSLLHPVFSAEWRLFSEANRGPYSFMFKREMCQAFKMSRLISGKYENKNGPRASVAALLKISKKFSSQLEP